MDGLLLSLVTVAGEAGIRTIVKEGWGQQNTVAKRKQGPVKAKSDLINAFFCVPSTPATLFFYSLSQGIFHLKTFTLAFSFSWKSHPQICMPCSFTFRILLKESFSVMLLMAARSNISSSLSLQYMYYIFPSLFHFFFVLNTILS